MAIIGQPKLNKQVTVHLFVEWIPILADPLNTVSALGIVIGHDLQVAQGLLGIHIAIGHQAQVATMCKIVAVSVGTNLDKLLGHLRLLFAVYALIIAEWQFWVNRFVPQKNP
jgi:hypothetical protein